MERAPVVAPVAAAAFAIVPGAILAPRARTFAAPMVWRRRRLAMFLTLGLRTVVWIAPVASGLAVTVATSRHLVPRAAPLRIAVGLRTRVAALAMRTALASTRLAGVSVAPSAFTGLATAAVLRVSIVVATALAANLGSAVVPRVVVLATAALMGRRVMSAIMPPMASLRGRLVDVSAPLAAGVRPMLITTTLAVPAIRVRTAAVVVPLVMVRTSRRVMTVMMPRGTGVRIAAVVATVAASMMAALPVAGTGRRVMTVMTARATTTIAVMAMTMVAALLMARTSGCVMRVMTPFAPPGPAVRAPVLLLPLLAILPVVLSTPRIARSLIRVRRA